MWQLLLAALVIGPTDALAPDAARLCSVRELRRSPGYRYDAARIRDFVDSATVIARVVAVGPDTLKWSRAAGADTVVRVVPAVTFRVVETLRGSVPDGRLVVPGRLVDRDDFNRGPVPYTLVRPSGQRGDCWAQEYRVGAEYLVLLRPGWSGLTPYWIPLAPLNEQVNGANDSWVEWVRAHVIRQPARRARPPTTTSAKPGE
jgi:hypothetical protein